MAGFAAAGLLCIKVWLRPYRKLGKGVGAFRVCVRTTLAVVAVPKGRPKVAQDVSPGYTPPTTISPEGTADNTQDDNPGTNFSGVPATPCARRDLFISSAKLERLWRSATAQCRHPIFAGDTSYVSVKFALQVRRYRLPTLRRCKYNVNQATNVTMRHDLSLPDCGRNISVPRTHVLGYSRPSPGDFSLSLEHNPGLASWATFGTFGRPFGTAILASAVLTQTLLAPARWQVPGVMRARSDRVLSPSRIFFCHHQDKHGPSVVTVGISLNVYAAKCRNSRVRPLGRT
jgi:hypothetical protein